jgi:cysteine desulfurase
MTAPIYFDNSATTPLDPRVRETMQPYLGQVFGNPSSLHWAGRVARQALDTARAQVAALLNANASDIVFTASGTEADNLALVGTVEAWDWNNVHLITSAIEHPAILQTMRYLEQRGIAITFLPVTASGLVEPDALVAAFRPNTRLVSIMTANNVVGTIQPIAELSQIAHAHGAWFHTDAVQAAGKLPIDTRATPIDLLSLSAHKLHGPKGVGALFVREGIPLHPLIHGGGQERGLRSATENVAGIVGLGCAAEIARAEMADDARRLVALRDMLIEWVLDAVPNAYLIGHRYRRLPGHVCLGFEGQEGEAIKLLLALDEEGIAVSTGSACSASHASEPSYILLAMGLDLIRARGSLRITLGRFNTAAEVDRFVDVLPRLVAALRPISSRYPASAK